MFIVLYGQGATGKTTFAQNSLSTVPRFDTSLPLKLFYISGQDDYQWEEIISLLDKGGVNIVCEMNVLTVQPELRPDVIIQFVKGKPPLLHLK